jgi:hypothetical protein
MGKDTVREEEQEFVGNARYSRSKAGSDSGPA